MRRFFVGRDRIKDKKAFFEEKEVNHIVSVLRAKLEDTVFFFDGSGTEYIGTLRRDKKGNLYAEIIEKRVKEVDNFPKITLFQAISKKDKMDLIIEKATELNVCSIVPIVTNRCVIKKQDVIDKYILRWKKITIEASKQCQRSIIPNISQPKKFLEAIEYAIANSKLSIFATLSDESISLKKAIGSSRLPDSITVFVGPEGDFTDAEVQLARDNNLKLISLCPSVLRVETASVFLLSVLNYEFYDG